MGRTYARIQIATEDTDESVSGYIERLVKADLDARGVPTPERPRPAPVKPATIDGTASGIFTF